MPPRYIFGVRDQNIPGPGIEAIAAYVKAKSGGRHPVGTHQIARDLNCSVGSAEYNLNLAKRMGLVQQVPAGWIAS